MRVKLFQMCSCMALLAALAVCNRLNAVAQEVPVPAKSSTARLPAYPLRLSANHRYLVDRNNKPFLIVGDTPQDLMSRLTEKEADRYFADRVEHGFNTMGWIDVTCAGPDSPDNKDSRTIDGSGNDFVTWKDPRDDSLCAGCGKGH